MRNVGFWGGPPPISTVSEPLTNSLWSPRSLGRFALLWGGVAAFFVGYRLFLYTVDGVAFPAPWAIVLGSHWLSWALATPVIVGLARR